MHIQGRVGDVTARGDSDVRRGRFSQCNLADLSEVTNASLQAPSEMSIELT